MKSVVTSTSKEFVTDFSMVLADQPVVSRVANTSLFGELLPDGTVLIFGGFDLVMCYRERNREEEYKREVISRAVVEKIKIPLKPAGLTAKAVRGAPVKVYTSRPLQARITACKPSQLRFWDLLKSLFFDLTWVNVRIEGELTVEAEFPAEEPPRECPVAAEGEVSRREDREAASSGEYRVEPAEEGAPPSEKKEEKKVLQRDHEILLDLETLAELALEVIRRREAEGSAGRDGSPRGPVRGEAGSGDRSPEAMEGPPNAPAPEKPGEPISEGPTGEAAGRSGEGTPSYSAESLGIPRAFLDYYRQFGLDEEAVAKMLRSSPAGGIPDKPEIPPVVMETGSGRYARFVPKH